jgi:hypothetical protein
MLTPRSSSQANLTVHAIDGMKKWKHPIHFAAAYIQQRKMQGETVGAQGYTSAAVDQSEDDLVEQSLGAFANLATATAVDQGGVAQLSEYSSRLAKQLEDNALSLKEIKALLKKEHAERAGSGNSDRTPRRTFTPSSDNYCWSHGYKLARIHTSQTFLYPKDGHKREATKTNNMGGSQANRD